MNVLSLFDGMSCGRVALERANIPVATYYASEIDKYAIQISQKNYPDIIHLGDINNWESWNVPWSDINLILAGSPCQGFSFAGKQLAFDDARSALFFRFAEILAHVQSLNPDVRFLLENVRMKKEFENVITSIVGVEPVMINSALVSAQNRKRLYWCNWDVKQPEDKGVLLREVIHETVDITNHDKLPKFNCNPSGKGMNGNVTPITSDKSPTLTTNKGEGSKIAIPLNAVVGIKQNPRGKNRGGIHTDKSPALTSNSFEHNNKIVYLVDREKNHAITALYSKKIDGYIRKLTPIECERLQTLPDNYTAGISNSQRYKMLGNGWTVDVIAHILQSLKSYQE